jgi:cation diffusion facilitator CzcD-associated flavoprotein CzcO
MVQRWYVAVPTRLVVRARELWRTAVQPTETHFSVAIAGTGFSGLGAAIRLKQAGFHDLVLFERAGEVGGVWRDNAYPGAACDVESHLYSFSFAPNPEWSHSFSRQPEIHGYLKQCALRFEINPHIRFKHSVREARWDEAQQRWVIETDKGTFTADFFLPAVGALSDPLIPNLPGLKKFQGKLFHSAQWDHDYDLKGKKVAVIGTGASAVQFIPEIQPKLEKLTLFQRTPAWVLPRWDARFSERKKALYKKVPALQKLARNAIYLRRELLVAGFRNPNLMKVVERLARRYLAASVLDPELRAKLTPSFRIGCKRILITADYLPALTRPNVEVVTTGIQELREHSIVTTDGVEHEVDAIIFGTGFHVLDLPFANHVRGRAGISLNEHWQGSPSAYLGTTINGFPNQFFLMGPGTGLGHTSVIVMLEAQLQILLGALEHMRRQKLAVIEPQKQVQHDYFAWLQRESQGTVWTAGGCDSWYLDPNGKLTSLWPHTTLSFRGKARFRPEEYALSQPSLQPSSAALAAE